MIFPLENPEFPISILGSSSATIFSEMFNHLLMKFAHIFKYQAFNVPFSGLFLLPQIHV